MNIANTDLTREIIELRKEINGCNKPIGDLDIFRLVNLVERLSRKVDKLETELDIKCKNSNC